MEKIRKAEGSVFPESPDTCIAFSPAALEAKKEALCALEEEDGSGIHWGHHYQVRLERTEQAYMAESWCLGCGNKRKPASHEVPHPKSPEREAQQ